MDEQLKLNIQPEAGILGVFSRLNYKPWYAIAEFVDNSTASYYKYEKEFKNVLKEKLRVKITYDGMTDVLTIVDNAYGMELFDFKRAIRLDSRPDNQDGRNEFGMGLKTAASWFGNLWSVESSQYGSENKYFAEVDIDWLREEKINSIEVIKEKTEIKEHFTKITIKKITKKITSGRTKGKIIELLSSMYRRDINSGNIEIIFNDTKLQFTPYEPLFYKEKRWEKEVMYSFNFGDEFYFVKGKVGILKEGGFGKAGFALFRRDRVIIGGVDENYKPLEIFGQIQSTISHKLYGEFDLEEFPVNQAKDGFVWDNGLEEEFVHSLKNVIKDYINIAKITNKERAKEQEYSKETAESVQKEVEPLLLNLIQEGTETKEISDEKVFDYKYEEKNLFDSDRYYTIENDFVKSELRVSWSIASNTYWVKFDKHENSITINIDHPFFKPFSTNEEFKIILEKFAIAYYLSERDSLKISKYEGHILSSTMRNCINEYLKKLSEE
ncbi:MAG: ATP-binding protein [Bacilli bacterium]